MAFNRKNWQDNVSDITAAELNRIEQGIYDNSLVVDAVTNTLNPTDTETYKTAELTEGQITDVIGVSDIIIKGQTSQDGEPTPSSPVDVNVVSGSNVIGIYNKNIINVENFATTAYGITVTKKGNVWEINGTATANNTFKLIPIIQNTLSGQYALTANYISGTKSGTANFNLRDNTSDSALFNVNLTTSNTTNTATLNNKVKYGIYIASGATFNNYKFSPQLEVGGTATTYETHQGKELPLDLGSIELCKIGDYQDYFYKSESKWYLHKEIERLILGDYNWTLANNTSISNINTNRWYISHPCSRLPNNNTKVIMSNILPMGTANSTYGQDELAIGQSTSQTVIRMPVEYTTASAIKTALQNLSAYAYVLKNEVTDTEITDTIQISQLEAIYNAPLYEQTNITQENNDLPMVLDITACKDNINGIKAFIRK